MWFFFLHSKLHSIAHGSPEGMNFELKVANFITLCLKSVHILTNYASNFLMCSIKKHTYLFFKVLVLLANVKLTLVYKIGLKTPKIPFLAENAQEMMTVRLFLIVTKMVIVSFQHKIKKSYELFVFALHNGIFFPFKFGFFIKRIFFFLRKN